MGCIALIVTLGILTAVYSYWGILGVIIAILLMESL